jgi:hypothetical protein
MLIKWENFGAFLFGFLRWEHFLTRDVLNKFYRSSRDRDAEHVHITNCKFVK